jgi:hypothetical protein
MQKSLATIGLSLAAAAVLTIPASAASPVPSASVSPAQIAAAQQQTATPVRKVTERRERHPEIRKAITSLERAKYALQHASHDFGGHRADALAATDKAIEQLRLALQYDKR